jgi:small subunit ribosomal protein S1
VDCLRKELWAFLGSLHRGGFLSGTVTAIERSGVFVGLDDGPDRPALASTGIGRTVIVDGTGEYGHAAQDGSGHAACHPCASEDS